MLSHLHWHPEGERQKPLFVEWVYFKFSSAEADGIVVFGCGWGMPGVVTVQLFPRGEAPVSVARHDFRLAETWRSQVDHRCRTANNEVRRTPTGYATTGALAQGSTDVSWALDYRALHPSIASFARHVGVLGLGTIEWDIIAPLAHVTGTVRVGPRTFTIDGHGYIDTNYGRWLFAVDPTTHWNWLWAHDTTPGSTLTVLGMDVRRSPRVGRLHVLDGAERIDFRTGAQTFHHLEFQTDPDTGVPVPTRTAVRASSHGHRLELEARNTSDYVYRQAIPPAVMRFGVPTPFEWDLVENFVTVEGTLTHPSGRVQDFRGTGIKEYPVTRLALHRD